MWKGKRGRAREQRDRNRQADMQRWMEEEQRATRANLLDDVAWIAKRLDPAVTDTQVHHAFEYVLLCSPSGSLVQKVAEGLGEPMTWTGAQRG